MRSDFSALPGADLVEVGLRDLATNTVTDESLLVSIGRPRLIQLGLDVPAGLVDPEHRLYESLCTQFGDAAHGLYNALVRRLVSFERALACVGSYAQALAKIELGHDRDLADVEAMITLELVDPVRLRAFFTAIEPELYRFPAIDPAAFRAAVVTATGGSAS